MMRQTNPKVIVILGPTASGKSDLAVEIALYLEKNSKKFNINGAEIISADSRQVYKGLDLASGKITKREMKGVPHYLLDVASPLKVFSVARYQKLTEKIINKLLKQNKVPIICGGTGFYIDSIIYNNKFPEVPPQKELREKLERLTETELFDKLNKLDPQRAKTIDAKNKVRLIRALEIVITTGKSSTLNVIEKKPKYNLLKIGIEWPREELKNRIKLRLIKRLKQGMITEIKKLRSPKIGKRVSWKRLNELGLEPRYISLYLQKIISKDQMIDELYKATCQYAKRQMTWFSDKDINWIKEEKEAIEKVEDFLA